MLIAMMKILGAVSPTLREKNNVLSHVMKMKLQPKKGQVLKGVRMMLSRNPQRTRVHACSPKRKTQAEILGGECGWCKRERE